ncbi:M23 family metallopeptidase [Streptomyces sp. RKAG337]|uniref:M23 family metallopeptidase n=1 Tax=Streptomyces sp. RKAG337 TaxID=2893404 RepID=UPI0020340165|nr:LysM peptidoglycan-binding domain-containing M23 family metallopeptidase [Streptomyces sp. RKAG337]MCM2429642.1 LysM peptidoglycan-binding domain-containing M23 family metallopeptidase [Streptomyces sp. RKAG337]
MPAKGKHRIGRMSRLTRICVAAGTGGAALALPLAMSSNAFAADTHVTAANAAASAPAHAAPAAKAAPAKTADKYKVVGGDSLSKIADVHHVNGGWQKLYADNKQTVGGNPDLIFPGQTLALGSKAVPSNSAPSADPAPKASPKASTETKTETKKAPAKKAPAKSESTVKSSSSADKAPAAASSSSGYTLPVSGASIGTPYHQSGSSWSSGYHTGVDFVVSTGTTVKAIAAGTVISAGDGGAYGNQVVIQHSDGKYSQYAHLSSLSVSAGETVTEGQQIGLSGATGNVTGPHLHFEIRTGPDYGSDIDPVAYLNEHGVTV